MFAGSNSTSVQDSSVEDDDESVEDMALMESVNNLIGTYQNPSSLARQNYYDLNGNLDNNDIVPLDFPGITPGDRNFSTVESTSVITEITGVGRPPQSPQRPQGSHQNAVDTRRGK